MKNLFITLFLIIIFSTKAYATNWVQVDKYNFIDTDSISTYVDDNGKTQRSKKSCLIKRINTDGFFNDIEKKLNIQIDSDITLVIFDFKLNKIARKAHNCYDSKGNTVYSYTYKNDELIWNDIEEGSQASYWAYLIKQKKLFKKAPAKTK